MRVGCLQPAGDGGRVPALHTLGKLRSIATGKQEGGRPERHRPSAAIGWRGTVLDWAKKKADETSPERRQRLEKERTRRAKKKMEEAAEEKVAA
ncbi:hypothetical protein PF005_g21647 [Phytophthora fragariae]|uniref:Uncharacterized protein n=1 Tax=Phytophthora fragariae TaxID=53985 RepID=A0A6A3R099_9STRA|nr:hypothetical protein PF009_g22583 [Phytophthora fragariae]KAE8985497.1 hypothetical protein PF011_g20368 [Phytophthora fragariae]KAE9083671.1 hypothetical protein PF010_g21126 [Phytophthora fragariae]KAE9086852.1 hypothetical protein PF007_g20604 [Phytophthora fragariae]KAE9108783.1 hypothetical protein PF006_g20803 [Phytophthora fragariae]